MSGEVTLRCFKRLVGPPSSFDVEVSGSKTVRYKPRSTGLRFSGSVDFRPATPSRGMPMMRLFSDGKVKFAGASSRARARSAIDALARSIEAPVRADVEIIGFETTRVSRVYDLGRRHPLPEIAEELRRAGIETLYDPSTSTTVRCEPSPQGSVVTIFASGKVLATSSDAEAAESAYSDVSRVVSSASRV